MANAHQLKIPISNSWLIVSPKKEIIKNNLDLFNDNIEYKTYKKNYTQRLIESTAEIALTFGDREFAFSELRQKCAQKLESNVWGYVGQRLLKIGYRIVRYQKSPIKSRAGGVEGVYQRK